MGYVEGRNVAIEFRWAQNDFNRLPELAPDLVRRRVAVIAALGTAAPLAAKALTSTIPIVFHDAGDPVQSGIVASINRPGGNVTGISVMDSELGAKRLGLLHELLPRAERFAALINRGSALADREIADLRAAAMAVGRDIEFFYAGTNGEIDTAFAKLVQRRIEALVVTPQGLFTERSAQIVRPTAPAIFRAILARSFHFPQLGRCRYGWCIGFDGLLDIRVERVIVWVKAGFIRTCLAL
jgi:putative ABC transport system substrate-binding protein